MHRQSERARRVPVIVIAHSDGSFSTPSGQHRCALGKTGVIAAVDKREGDGKSPLGTWPMLRVVYRADRGAAPETRLPVAPIQRDDGWCDAPGDANYNRPVKLPYPASHEEMWREDGLYDVVVILGHNDSPAVPGRGSAIFMHCARPDYGPTQGCVALAKPDLLQVLSMCGLGDAVEIRES
jgi:L,D-peptidoglycan transpeptidase YkuD (ErfK/YbiS/YcfS/YnhG family)